MNIFITSGPGIHYACKTDPLKLKFTTSQLRRLRKDDEQRLDDMGTGRTNVQTVGRLQIFHF